MRDIKKYIRENYKKYLSKDDVKSPRIPNFKLDKLEEQIKRRKIAKSISDSKEFIEAFEELNTFYEGQPLNKFEEWGCSGGKKWGTNGKEGESILSWFL